MLQKQLFLYFALCADNCQNHVLLIQTAQVIEASVHTEQILFIAYLIWGFAAEEQCNGVFR